MTSAADYYRGNVTWVGSLDRRLSTLVDLTAARQPSHVLDLGCGEGVLLDALAARLRASTQLVGTSSRHQRLPRGAA